MQLGKPFGEGLGRGPAGCSAAHGRDQQVSLPSGDEIIQRQDEGIDQEHGKITFAIAARKVADLVAGLPRLAVKDGLEPERVGARSAEQHIAPKAADERVTAVAAFQPIVPVASDQKVVATSAEQLIIAIAALEGVL